METIDIGEESQGGESQSTQNNRGEQTAQHQQGKESSPRTLFLEYPTWREGQHNISAIIKDQGDKRGIVAARIFTEFSGEPKRPTYSVKDAEGNVLFPPSQKLWEVKKEIMQNSRPLLEKAKLLKNSPAIGKTGKKKEEPVVEKEAKEIGNKVVDEAKAFGDQGKDIILGTGREHELKNIRNKSQQKSKDLQR